MFIDGSLKSVFVCFVFLSEIQKETRVPKLSKWTFMFLIFFSETTWPIRTKPNRNVHWMSSKRLTFVLIRSTQRNKKPKGFKNENCLFLIFLETTVPIWTNKFSDMFSSHGQRPSRHNLASVVRRLLTFRSGWFSNKSSVFICSPGQRSCRHLDSVVCELFSFESSPLKRLVQGPITGQLFNHNN